MKRRAFLQQAGIAATIAGASSASLGARTLAEIITTKPNDPRIHYYGFANLKVSSAGAVSDRMVLDSPFRTDNPAARIQFDTDASQVDLVLSYVRKDAIAGRSHWSSEGMVMVDGADALKIGRIQGSSGPQVTTVRLGQQGRRLIEIILPYADSVTFFGLGLPKGAELYAFPREQAKRYVAYGDSITQGFQARNPVETYPLILARAKKWELVNMGFGSRKATQPDGAVLGRLKPDVMTILIGVNDCLQKKPLDRFGADMAGLITEFRRVMPRAPIYVITPLPVAEPAKWPGADQLDAYRMVIQDKLGRLNDASLKLIDGHDLINADPKFFADGLHPNAEGFRRIAAKLGVRIGSLEQGAGMD